MTTLTRAGTNINFTGEVTVRVAPSLAAVVAVPVTHDWGPLGNERGGNRLVTSVAEFDAAYGSSDTAGRRAVIMALNGQGPESGGGAGAVIVHRMGVPVKATATIKNTTATTPPDALSLTALFGGVRGNRISYIIADDPRDATKDRLTLLVDGAVQERYSYLDTDIAALAAAVNARSSLVVAESLVDGVALASTAGSSLTAGSDGPALVGADYTSTLNALTQARFTVLAFPNLTDAAIIASAVEWVRGQVDANRPSILVIGGAAGDTIDTALARSVAVNDPHVVNLGVGLYHDEMLERDVSTAELAPRIAGVLAARGEERSLTFAKVSGLYAAVADSAPDDGEIVEAIIGGVTVLSPSTSPDAELKIEKGVTTFLTETDAGRPRELFGDPRLVRIMDLYVRGMKEWGDEVIVGDTTVTDDTRSTVQGEGKSRQDDLERRGLLVPGTAFILVTDPGDDSSDQIPYKFGWRFARTTNNLIGEGKVR